jgi:hypothetical protein
MGRKNLILACVGDESVHGTWLGAKERSFDLGLIYFGDQTGRYAQEAEYYFARKGIKYALLHDAVQAIGPAIDRYDYIWMPDDDIAADARYVEQLFKIAADYRLAISQPAIGLGDVSFRALRANPEFVLRYSRFVEIMCPLFSREALRRVLPTFRLNVSAWGIDWLWASMFGPEELAVVDAAPVHHTRPLSSGGVHRRLAALGVDPGQERDAVLQTYGIHNLRFQRSFRRGTSRLVGVRLDGQRTWTRSWWSSILPGKAA